MCRNEQILYPTVESYTVRSCDTTFIGIYTPSRKRKLSHAVFGSWAEKIVHLFTTKLENDGCPSF